jgi:hypothetical protein
VPEHMKHDPIRLAVITAALLVATAFATISAMP